MRRSVTGALAGILSLIVLTGCVPANAARDPGSEYLVLADLLNERVAVLGDRVDSATQLAEMHAIFLEYAAVEADLIAGLRALPVPESAADEVQAAIAAAEVVERLNRQASVATGDLARRLGDDLTIALDAQRAALRRLRAALGLPTTLG